MQLQVVTGISLTVECADGVRVTGVRLSDPRQKNMCYTLSTFGVLWLKNHLMRDVLHARW